MIKNPDIFESIKKGCEIESRFEYYALVEPGKWRVINLRGLMRALSEGDSEPVSSLRLATGIIGTLQCKSGNRGPRGYQEVIFGLGNDGIAGLLTLGALECITCGKLSDEEKQAQIRSYDARRLDWSQILKLEIAPDRFYTRPGLSGKAVSKIAEIFSSRNIRVPAIGYYDAKASGRFATY